MNRRDFIKYGTFIAGVGGFCVFCNDGIVFSQDNITEESLLDKRPCKKPFEYCEIHKQGDVSPCCPDFLKYGTPAGNIKNQSFDEIWTGKIFKDLRERVLNSRFLCCTLNNRR